MQSHPTLILATRFSWPHPIWESKSEAEYEYWINERILLFEMYTCRSIANCYVKPDYWVILIGQNHNHIQERLLPILTKTGCNFTFAPYMGADLGLSTMLACKGVTYPAKIITTNLDADDLIANDFFDVLRSLPYPRSGNASISYCSGSNYMPDENKYFHSSYPSNPFLSLYEPCRSAHEAQTVFFRMHTEQMNFVQCQIFPRSYYPMWSSVIHGGNLANHSLIETNRVSFQETALLHERFGLDPSLQSRIDFNV